MRLEERGIGGAGEEGAVAQHVDQQVAVRSDAVHPRAGQRVGEDQPPFRIGVRDLHRLARATAHHIARPHGVSGDPVLDGGDEEVQAHGQARRHDEFGKRQRMCRATQQDRKMASLLGIDVDKTISITFIMGAALASVAGTMYLMYYGVASFNDGFIPGVKAFTAAVLGGIGSLPGAVLGGLLIGLIESLWSAYFSIAYKDVAAFGILAFVLIFKPTGILGRPEVEKV